MLLPATRQHHPGGIQVVTGRAAELRRILDELTADDLGELDASLGQWLERPLGREMLASTVLSTAGTVYVCLLNLEPAGFIVVERGRDAGRVRGLAVAPDLRRRGVARALLNEAASRAFERGLSWLWLHVRATNAGAAKTALACEFRRVLPQFLRRERAGLPAATFARERVRVEPANARDTRELLDMWPTAEIAAGDAWLAEIAQTDLRKLVQPEAGHAFFLSVDEQPAGAATLEQLGDRFELRTWLAPPLWGTPQELALVRAVLAPHVSRPATLDYVPGSSGHLRLAAEHFRPHGFELALKPAQTFARRIAPD